MEKSLLSFAATYPGWVPGPDAANMLASVGPAAAPPLPGTASVLPCFDLKRSRNFPYLFRTGLTVHLKASDCTYPNSTGSKLVYRVLPLCTSADRRQHLRELIW